MITFIQNTELFTPGEVIVFIDCKYFPEISKKESRCKIDQLEIYKKNITISLLNELVIKMAKQRFENLSHSNKLRENQLDAYTQIKKSIGYYNFKIDSVLHSIYTNKIIPSLECLRPGKNSKFFKNYTEKLNDIKKFINYSNLFIKN